MKLTRVLMIVAVFAFLWMWGLASTRDPSFDVYRAPRVVTVQPTRPPPVLRAAEEDPERRPRALPDTVTEPSLLDHLVLKAVSCSDPEQSDPALYYKLLDIEVSYGVPETLRGMVLAAACNESSMNPDAEGDHKRAVGILQLWPWWERTYQVNRRDPVASAHAWLQHISRRLPKVYARCRPKSEAQAWKQAWVTAVRAPHPEGVRCREVRSLRHLWRLRWWMESWRSS